MATLLIILVATVIIDRADAQTEPPASGDWTVTDVTVIENRTVDLRGDLTVTSNGNLTLRNTTLRIYSTITVDHGILVKDNGTLVIEDGDQDHLTTDDRSVISRGVPSLGYFFVVENDARYLNIYASEVNSPGAQTRSGGVLIRNDWVSLRHSTFSHGTEYDVKIEGSDGPRISSCDFYTSKAGLVLEDVRNVTVTLCNFTKNGAVGIQLDNATDTMISICRVSGSTNLGISVRRCLDVQVLRCHILESPWGMELDGVTNLTVSDTIVNGTTFDGVEIVGTCDNITFVSCQVYNIGRTAIDAESVSNLTLDKCLIANATYYGFRLENGTRDIVIKTCNIRFCGYDGINLAGAVDVEITFNMLHHNGYNGAFVVDSADVLLYRNSFTQNGYDGMNLDNVRDAVVDFNFPYENGYNGFNLQAGCYNVTIVRSVARNNTRCGLGLDSVHNISLDHNELSHNGGFGLLIEGSSYDIQGYEITLRQNVDGALRVESSWDIWMNSTTIIQPPTSTYGLYVRSAGDVWLVDSQVRGTVQVSRGGNATIISPTGGQEFTPDVDGTSWLDLAYWVQVEVVWPDTLPVDGAYVNATATGGRLLMEARTNSSGLTDILPVTVTRWVASAAIPTNPITFRASKGNVWAHNTTTILNDTRVHIILQDSVHPIAIAGNVTAELGFVTELDGRGSWDNGEIDSWLWTFDDGVGTVELEGRTVNWTFTVLGNFSGQLKVADLVGLTNVTVFHIKVVDTTSPVARAGENVTVDQHTQVVLDGRNTTDNDATLLATGSYIWSIFIEGGGVVPIAVRQGFLETYTFDEMGLFRVRLTVTDQSGNDGFDELWVDILDTTPPVAVLGDDLEVDQGAMVTLKPSEVWDNDPGFDPVNTTEWRVVGPDLDLVFKGSLLEYTLEVMGTYQVWMNVTDPSGNMAGDTMTITVIDTTPPQVPAGEDRTVEIGSEVHLDANGTTDNDPAFPDDALFKWSIRGPELDLLLNGVTASFEPPWIGDYVVTLTVTDAAGNSANSSFTVTSVDTSFPEYHPLLPDPQQLSNTTTVRVIIVASDHGTGVDPDRVHFRLRDPGADEWSEWEQVELNDFTGMLWAMFDLTFEEGTTLLQARIYDRAGNGPVLSEEHPIRVNARPHAFILTPAEGSKYGVHDEIMLDASASSDPDNDTLYFRWESDRDGLLGTDASVRAPPLTSGEHRLTVTVFDGVEGHEVYAHVTITVLPEPSVVDSDGGVPWFLWVLLIILALTAGLLTWETWFRERRPPEDPEVDVTGDTSGDGF